MNKDTEVQKGIPEEAGGFARLNAEFWMRGDFVKHYATTELRPVEAVLLERHRAALAGRVLELGCGAGRVTGHLGEIAQSLHGLDLSAAMVAYCRRTYPEATFSQGDLRDLSMFKNSSYDVVVASFNVLDVLDDGERRSVLEAIVRILAGGGLLVMSTHNRDYAPFIRRPTQLSTASPRGFAASVVRLPRRLRNRRRLLAHQRSERDYAILNDSGHDYSVLHYYISRDAQERQFREHGFELLECLDLDGRSVEADATAAHCPELHYVARRAFAAGVADPD